VWSAAVDGTVTLPSITSSNLNGGTLIVATVDQESQIVTASAGYTELFAASLSYNRVLVAVKSVTPGTYTPTFENSDLNGGPSVALILGGTGLAAPSFTSEPEQQTKAIGQTATFSCAATNNGGTGMAYQWKLNGANISGATSSSYTTPTIVAGDNGNIFEVIITDSLGSKKSARAGLYLSGQGSLGHGSYAGTSAVTSARRRRRNGLSPITSSIAFGNEDTVEETAFGNFFFTSLPPATRTLVAAKTSLVVTGQSATLARSRLFATVEIGSFALTGKLTTQSSGILIGQGVFTVTGAPSTLAAAYKFIAEPASFSLAGTQATMGVPSSMYAATGSFVATGSPSTDIRTRLLSASPATFAISGVAASMPRGTQLSASTGAFAQVGQQSQYSRALQLSSATGSLTLSGAPATTPRALALQAQAGAFSSAYQNPIIDRSYCMLADTATLSLFGGTSSNSTSVAGLTQTGVFDIQGFPSTGEYVVNMIAFQGGLAVIGAPATFSRVRNLNALPASFVLLTPAAALLTGKSMIAGSAVFSAVPSAPFLYLVKGVTAFPSVFGISNFSVSGNYTRGLTAQTSSITVSGLDASMYQGDLAFNLSAGTGAFALLGNSATLAKALKANAVCGAFAVTGVPSTGTAPNLTLIAEPGTHIVSGLLSTGLRGSGMSASPAALSVTGVGSLTVRVRNLAALPAGIAVTAPSAVMLNSQVTAPILFAENGAIIVTGMSVGTVKGKTLNLQAGTFSITGFELQSVTPKIRAVMKSKMGTRFMNLAPITSRTQARSPITVSDVNFSTFTTRGRVKSTMMRRKILTSAILGPI
jgi:hypothetical protein